MTASNLACPRDAVAMELQAYWKHPRHRCAQCEGLFLSPAHLAETLGARTGEGMREYAAGTVKTAAGAMLASLPESSLRCPCDATSMRVLRYKKVELDVCGECGGVWFDRGEYAKVLEARKRLPAPAGAGDDPLKNADLVLAVAAFAAEAVLPFLGP